MTLVEIRDSWPRGENTVYFYGFGLTRHPEHVRQFLESRRIWNRRGGDRAYLAYHGTHKDYGPSAKCWPIHIENESGIYCAEVRLLFWGEKAVYVVSYAYNYLDVPEIPEYFYKTMTYPRLVPAFYENGPYRARHLGILLGGFSV